jgi:hypothetical protein
MRVRWVGGIYSAFYVGLPWLCFFACKHARRGEEEMGGQPTIGGSNDPIWGHVITLVFHFEGHPIHVTSSSAIERKHMCDPIAHTTRDVVGRIMEACGKV